mmetsp:Transcript_6751/g.10861  ORF Transcript_6751/g.10861 Transcript_6751/m.10861 type:complete len:83 (-) Transcript_6751:1531-1779(-)
MNTARPKLEDYCRFFPSCSRGQTCSFRHPQSDKEAAALERARSKAKLAKKGTCHFFSQGTCKKGAMCEFYHPPASSPAKLAP